MKDSELIKTNSLKEKYFWPKEVIVKLQDLLKMKKLK